DLFLGAPLPFVDGRSFTWCEFTTPEHQRAVLDLVIAVHTAPATASRWAVTDDFAVSHRDELQAALDGGDGPGDWGPYARPAAALLVEYAAPVQRLLAQYDELVVQAGAQP